MTIADDRGSVNQSVNQSIMINHSISVVFSFSIHLFFMFPYHDEGEMTTYRGSLVQNKNLTELAKVG